MKLPTYKLEDSLGRIVQHAHRDLINRLHSNFLSSGFDVTPGHFQILIILSHQDGLSQQELSEKVAKEKSGIARLVSGLEKRDLVKRITEDTDGRKKLVFLTSKGRGIIGSLKDLVQQTNLEAYKGISEEEMKICKEVLKTITRNLKGDVTI